jgi:hypothetical protein
MKRRQHTLADSLALKSWCQVVAQGNPEKLAKRLVWDEWIMALLLRFSVLFSSSMATTPRLDETLREALQTDGNSLYQYQSLSGNRKPNSFEEVICPLLY